MEHLTLAFQQGSSYPYSLNLKYKSSLKKLKHTSLFHRNLSDKEKKGFVRLTPGPKP